MRRSVFACLLVTGAVTFGYQAGSQDTASIEGRAIAQGTGAALKNAVVTLRQIPAGSGQLSTGQLVQQTNEEGRFSFTGIAGGDWELSAEKRGFIPGKYGARKYDPNGSRISVGPGGQVTDLVLKLVPQTAITGRVLDPAGEPVEGARIALLKVRYNGDTRHWSEVASALTLDNGEYRIPRVPPSRYLVKCGITELHSSGIDTTYAGTYYPNVAEPSQAGEIEVRGDGAEINGVDMRVAPVRVFHVRGRFLPPSGQQSHAVVFLLERSDPSRVLAQSGARPPDYVFDMPRVPPGSYVVYAYSMEDSESRASQPLEVKEQDVDILLSPAPGEIQGSVKLKPGDRQIDLSALSVKIRPVFFEGGSGYGVWRSVEFAGGLKFRHSVHWGFFASFAVRIANLPEGCYVASVQYGGREVRQPEIEDAPGAALEITIASDGARVNGRTLDEQGNPRDSAVVALIAAGGKSAMRSVKSGPGGVFQITGIPPGEYKLLAFDNVGQEDLENPDFIKLFEGQATAVKLDASQGAAASIRVIAQEQAGT